MIDETIKNVVTSLVPSSGYNLLGMDIDICHYFETSPCLSFKSRKQTDDSSCMFIINLEATENTKSLADISSALLEIWENLAYSYFEAHSIKNCKTASVLRFVTVIDENSFYVTGMAVVSGKQYEILAKEHEINFSELPNAY